MDQETDAVADGELHGARLVAASSNGERTTDRVRRRLEVAGMSWQSKPVRLDELSADAMVP